MPREQEEREVAVSAGWTGEADGLVGRDAVLADLRGLLTGGRRTAVLLGLPGAGKTSVTEFAGRGAGAEGWTVLTAAGHVAERDLAFGTLAGLASARAVRDRPAAAERAAVLLDRLAPADGAGGSTDALRLRLDVLDLLEALADDGPVLLVVDDAQWVDASSLTVLAFVANRLEGSRVSVILAARGEEPPPGLEHHPRVLLPPLDAVQSGQVLRRAGVDLDPVNRVRVVERAAGNPLALLELGRAALDAPPGTEPGTPGATPLAPSSVEAVYAASLTELPASARALLVLAAAGGDDLAVLARAADPATVAVDLAPAERAGLVRVVDRSVVFRHPLARSAVYAGVTTAERLEAHERLAEAYADEPDRAVWHRAHATVVPDEDVARRLEEMAARARERGAFSEAARALTRAADLTPQRADRERRFLDALSLTLPAGHVDWLARLAGRVREETDDPATRARATHFVAYALSRTMRQSAAVQALDDALEQLVALEGDLGWGSLTTLASLTYQSGRDTAVVADWLRRYQRDAPPVTGPLAALVEGAQAWVRAAATPLERPPELVGLVRTAAPLDSTHPPDLVSTREMLLGAAGWLLDEPDAALRRLRKAVEIMERTQAPGQLTQTYAALAQVLLDAGVYDEADAVGQRLVDLADAENLSYTADIGRILRARVAAVRGDAPLARRLAREVLVDVEVGQALALECNARSALAGAAFAERDLGGRFDHLRALFHADGTPVHPHVSYRSLGDLAAAAVAAGRPEDARPVLRVAADRFPARLGARHRLHLHRARALLGSEAEAESHHQRAVGERAFAQWPFELAQARVEHGAWLRRQRRTAEARVQLREALTTFDRLGARPWSDLARRELRAAGVTEPASAAVDGDRGRTAWDDLTAQEREVVRLAASGMTNREIGGSLFLSPRTVSAHLYNAFPKLGVTSRAQLRDVVPADD